MRGVAAEGASTPSFGLVGPRSALRAADAPPCSSLLSGGPPRLDKTHGATPAAAGLEDAADDVLGRGAQRHRGVHEDVGSQDDVVGHPPDCLGRAEEIKDVPRPRQLARPSLDGCPHVRTHTL